MGDDLAFEMRRSTSPNNYRQQEPITESQPPAVGGKEPVQAVAYNPLTASLDQISGLVPTYATNMMATTTGGHPTTVTTGTTGYVNGGHSINFRPRHAQPMDSRTGIGVGEVDFDTKCTDAYANLDDVRDRDYQTAARGPMFRGVTNRSKEQKRKAKVSICFGSFVFFIFVMEVVILILAVFNLVNGLEVGSLTRSLVSSSSTGSSSGQGQTSTVESLTHMISNLTKELERLNSTLNAYQKEHGTNINLISNKVLSLNRTVVNLTSDNPGDGSQFVNVTFPLNREGCVTDSTRCSTGAVNVNSGLPGFSYCSTNPYKHNETDTSMYLADIFCSMDRDDIVMPISASLTLTSSGYRCFCSGVEIPNVVENELDAFRCTLHYTICPSSLSVAVPLQ